MLKCGGGGDGRLLKAILDRRHGISGGKLPLRFPRSWFAFLRSKGGPITDLDAEPRFATAC